MSMDAIKEISFKYKRSSGEKISFPILFSAIKTPFLIYS